MPDFIQFPCPACGITLRIPLEIAGELAAPCPQCSQKIVPPDPVTGRAAFAVWSRKPAPAPPPVFPAVQPSSSGASVRAESPAWVFCVLLATGLAFSAGWFFGKQSSENKIAKSLAPAAPAAPQLPRSAPTETPIVPPPVTARVEAPENRPVLVKPNLTPEIPLPAGPRKTAALQAEETLRAFLDAPDWPRRAAYVSDAARVRPLMKRYAENHPDGSTAFSDLTLESTTTDPATHGTLFVFLVKTSSRPAGFPVAVYESADGWLVDWETFVEFRDEHFKTLANGPAGAARALHVIVSRPSEEQSAATENEYFSSFLAGPALGGKQTVYVRKGTEAQRQLAAATENGPSAPVLTIAKRSTPDDKSYLEITGVIAGDWMKGSR